MLFRALSLESESFEVGANRRFQFGGFSELGIQFRYEAHHFIGEGFAVVFHFLCADVATGREDESVALDFLQRC